MAGDRKMWEQWKDWRLTEPINEGSKAVKALKDVNKSVISTIKGIKNFRKIIDDSPYVPVLTTISQELYRFEIDLEKKLRLLLSVNLSIVLIKAPPSSFFSVNICFNLIISFS